MIEAAAAGAMAMETHGCGSDSPPARNRETARGGATDAPSALAMRRSDIPRLRYASKDGDVLEVANARRENVFEAEADADARLAKLARLRDWAAHVAEEVGRQQKRILEESMRRSGSFLPGSDGRFIVVYPEPEAERAETEDCEAGIPEYWNAENTSDRIVHFAAQMAEIAGGDREFAEAMVKAVADGFDLADTDTGPLPGKAGELNRKTRELTFSKLSKWLDERKSMDYNQEALNQNISTAEAPHGTQNHEQ